MCCCAFVFDDDNWDSLLIISTGLGVIDIVQEMNRAAFGGWAS